MTGPERIWIEGEEACPYFYDESELADASGPLVGYVRADIHDEVVKALREIAELSERKKSLFPQDWRDQIESCPECRRYKGHPIQNGICDEHRKPIYAQEDHDRHETKILGYRAKDIARAALARTILPIDTTKQTD